MSRNEIEIPASRALCLKGSPAFDVTEPKNYIATTAISLKGSPAFDVTELQLEFLSSFF